MWATYKGHTDTVQLLLERNADVNAHGNYHISSLLWASGRGHVDIVRMLVRRGAKVHHSHYCPIPYASTSSMRYSFFSLSKAIFI